MAPGHKKRFAANRAVLWLLILFSYMRAYATAIPRLRLEELVSASDVVAVGQVGLARITGTGAIQVGAEIAQAQFFSVDVTVLRLLKGECAAETIVMYALPSSPATGYRAIGTGTRLLFLRHSSEGLAVTNPYYPSLPASAAHPGPSGPDLVAKVVDELGGVLASETEAASVKQQVLDIAYAVPPDEQFTASLRRAMDTSDLDLRYRVMANLVRRRDAGVLPRVTELLLTTDFPVRYRNMFEYVIGTSVTDTAAVPLLGRLLHSPYPSTHAAVVEAFWHIGTWSVVPSATAALTDPDQRTRYYAVRALAAVTGQKEWGPSIPEFQEHEKRYVQHWLDWAKASGQ